MSRSSTIRRVRRRARQIATIALTAGVGCAAFVTNGFGASAGAAAAVPAVPTFTLHKANFAIAPGAGFFLDEAHIRSGLDNFKTLGVHWIRSTIPWGNFEPNDPTKLAPGESAYDWKGVDQFVATLN
jgi:hypothetical protein